MMRRQLSQGVGHANGGLHHGEKLLGLTVVNGSIDTLELLLDNDMDMKTPKGQKALTHVIKFGSSEGLIAMVEKGADINTEFEKKTALYIAAENGWWKDMKKLAVKGARVYAEYKSKTALQGTWRWKMGHHTLSRN